MEKDQLNVDTICGGALAELFGRAVRQVVENIQDVNAHRDSKREITVKATFKPYSDRNGAEIELVVECKLASADRVKGTMFIAQRGTSRLAFAHNPAQLNLQPSPQTERKQ